MFYCHFHITFRIALVTVVLSIFRMQKLAQEQNDKFEKVNRERKYHQVNMTFLSTLVTVIC
jgi:uridine phosphorylase